MRINTIAGIIITALGSQSAVATHLNHYDVARQIFDVSYKLHLLAEENRSDLCSGDVLIAATYLKSAGAQVQQHKKESALVSMAYGHNELKEISKVRSYCASLSHKVKPYLAQVIVMKSKLESSTLPETDATSD